MERFLFHVSHDDLIIKIGAAQDYVSLIIDVCLFKYPIAFFCRMKTRNVYFPGKVKKCIPELVKLSVNHEWKFFHLRKMIVFFIVMADTHPGEPRVKEGLNIIFGLQIISVC